MYYGGPRPDSRISIVRKRNIEGQRSRGNIAEARVSVRAVKQLQTTLVLANLLLLPQYNLDQDTDIS